MTIREVERGAVFGVVVATDPSEILAAALIETNLLGEESEDAVATSGREHARSANAAMVDHMREAAHWELAKGVASGAAKIGSAACTGISTGVAAGGASSADPTGETDPATATAPLDATGSGPDLGAPASARGTGGTGGRPRSDGGWDAAADGLSGSGDVIGAAFGMVGGEAHAAEARDRAVAEEASSRASEAADGAGSTAGARDRLIAAFSRIVEEKRRAEEAATRA